MYSIPEYSLRFAAHCRSRLKYLEVGAHDEARGSTVANAARFWIRFAPNEVHANRSGYCTTLQAQGDAP